MMRKLERFIDSHVLSPMSSVEFVTDIGFADRHRKQKWRIVHELYGSESKEVRVADSIDELLDIFVPDEDVHTLRETLSMPHVLAVEFNMMRGTFNVDAYVALRKIDSNSIGQSYIIVSESSRHHRISPLYALRRRLAIDLTPFDVWRSTMRHYGHDVRLVRKGDAFSVLVYDIADDNDEQKPKYETHGVSPYEALAPWNMFVSDIASEEFENADD